MGSYDRADCSLYLASLHLYDDAIILDRPGELAYCVDPLDVATALTGIRTGSGLLPEGVLWYATKSGQESIAVWVHPRRWTVQVHGEKRAWRIPLPGLVFAGHGVAYQVYATKGDAWPGPDTPLYHAPTPNVHSGQRGVCRGSAPFPVASAATIWEAVEVFFGSGFNVDLGNGKSRKHSDSILKQWRALHKAKATEYPEADLVETGLRLKDLLK